MISRFILRQAASCCHTGGVIAYPTESVYGLGCDPLNSVAVAKILQLKQRQPEKGLILIAGSLEQLLPFIDISSQQQDQLHSSDDQAITWLVKPSALAPLWITGQHSKIAVRITQHPIARDLCLTTGYPLVSTSANPAGLEPARTSLAVKHYFDDDIDFLLHGAVGQLKRPTEIRDLETQQVIRKG